MTDDPSQLGRVNLADAAMVVATPAEASASRAGLIVAVPGIAGFSPVQREIAVMLPVTDINGALIVAAADFVDVRVPGPGDGKSLAQGARASNRLCAGLLLIDPFLVIGDMVTALRAGGFTAVANYPTVQMVDGDGGAGLAAVGYDVAAELRQLVGLSAHGFTPHAYVTDASTARAALAAGIRDLVFHSGFRSAAEATEALGMVRRAIQAAATTDDGVRLRIHVSG